MPLFVITIKAHTLFTKTHTLFTTIHTTSLKICSFNYLKKSKWIHTLLANQGKIAKVRPTEYYIVHR